MAITGKLSKWANQGALTLVIPAILWIGINQFDTKLNPEFNGFFIEATPIADSENGLIAINAFGQLYGSDNTTGTPEPKPAGVKCWGEQKNPQKGITFTSCATETELRQQLADKAAALEAFTALYKYQHFDQQDVLGTYRGQALLDLQTLHMAQLALTAEQGHAAQSLDQWIANAQFTQRLTASRQGFVGQTIAIILRGDTIAVFPRIAEHATAQELAARQSQLNEIFDAPTFGKGGWDMAETMRVEYGLLKALDSDNYAPFSLDRHQLLFQFSYLPNATRNQFYDYAQEMIAISKLSLADLRTMHPELLADQSVHSQSATAAPWYNLFYNAAGRLLMDNMKVARNLLLAPHVQTSKLRLLKLYTSAKIAGIKQDDMADFVAKAPADMRNPFSNQSFTWDAVTHSIAFASPKQNTPGLYFEVIY